MKDTKRDRMATPPDDEPDEAELTEEEMEKVPQGGGRAGPFVPFPGFGRFNPPLHPAELPAPPPNPPKP